MRQRQCSGTSHALVLIVPGPAEFWTIVLDQAALPEAWFFGSLDSCASKSSLYLTVEFLTQSKVLTNTHINEIFLGGRSSPTERCGEKVSEV